MLSVLTVNKKKYGFCKSCLVKGTEIRVADFFYQNREEAAKKTSSL